MLLRLLVVNILPSCWVLRGLVALLCLRWCCWSGFLVLERVLITNRITVIMRGSPFSHPPPFPLPLPSLLHCHFYYFFRINRDTLLTKERCYSAARAALKVKNPPFFLPFLFGLRLQFHLHFFFFFFFFFFFSFFFSSENQLSLITPTQTPSIRKPYIDIAKECGAPVRAITLVVDLKVAFERNVKRFESGGAPMVYFIFFSLSFFFFLSFFLSLVLNPIFQVPKISYLMFRKSFETPALSEGFCLVETYTNTP